MRSGVGTTLLVVLTLVVAGCGSSSKKSSSSAPSQSAPGAGAQVGAPGAKVVFVQPKSGSSVGTTVKVRVRITGFKLSPKTVGKPPKQGQGHLHFKMDGGKFDQPKYSGANGKLAVKLGVQGKYSPSVKPSITYKGLPKGQHKLDVSLANNDHSNTGVEASTSFTIK